MNKKSNTSELKAYYVGFALTEEQKDRLVAEAKRNNLETATFVRVKILEILDNSKGEEIKN